MKLAKGTLKVIVGDVERAEENQERARNHGKIFVPVYTIYEWDEETETLEVFKSHSFRSHDLIPRTNRTSKFPHKWAPSALRDTVMWLETTGEVTLLMNQEDSNG